MAYQHFSADDLAADSYFRQWVLQPDPNAERFWTDFLQQHPEQTDTVAHAAQLVWQLAQATAPAFTPASVAEQQEAIWRSLQQGLAEHADKPIRAGRIIGPPPAWGRWAVAATVLLTLGAGWWFYERKAVDSPTHSSVPSIARSDGSMRERINRTARAETMTLSDNSIVTLQPGSRLRYPMRFAPDKREVSLTGEAFFRVARNPARPFLVYAGQTVTKVLGTSFRVRAYERDNTVSVVVRTGLVSVFSRRNFDRIGLKPTQQVAGLLLTPNQRATFYKATEQLAKDLIEKPLPLLSVPQKVEFVFDDRPVSEVLMTLETMYGLTIIFDKETLSHCPITTTLFKDEELHQRLHRICRAIGATYEVVDGQIIINSSGCIP